MKKITLIVGSLRAGSFNRQLADHAAALLEGRAEVSLLDYRDLPFFNQDLESPVLPAVARVRQAVQEADALWIFPPEYNWQIPGVLKNLLDWLSRPADPDDRRSASVLKGKRVTVSGVAGSSAAAQVRPVLTALLRILSMEVVGGDGGGVALNAEAFQTGVLPFTEEHRAALAEQAEALL